MQISIHPMLRFNIVTLKKENAELNFNTSYVTVQLVYEKGQNNIITEFQYILCYGSTSDTKTTSGSNAVFQYILCYGSTFSCCH